MRFDSPSQAVPDFMDPNNVLVQPRSLENSHRLSRRESNPIEQDILAPREAEHWMREAGR
jgi:hypothetical protein